MILGGPFRQGLLAGINRELIADVREGRKLDYRLEDRSLIPRIEAIYDLSKETGVPLPEMATRFLLSDPDIATMIPGPSSVQDLKCNLDAALKGPLPRAILDEIDRICQK